MTTVIDGNELAAEIRDGLSDAISELEAHGVTPGLATVLMNDNPDSETYVNMKQRDCEEVGISTIDERLDPEDPAEELFRVIDDLNANPNVHGILVQSPLPEQVDAEVAFERIDPAKDVDGFHPENVGKLVRGRPTLKPCTPHGVQRMLQAADIELEGADVVVVGRSNIVGKPLANLLAQKTEGGNATVTLCHSRTDDLAAHTRRADVVVAAAGVPELVDGDMLSEGVAVIDVGINPVDADNEKGYELVGDVDFESAKEKADVISPVPGGVGPMTRAMLLYNTVKAASQQEATPVDLP